MKIDDLKTSLSLSKSESNSILEENKNILLRLVSTGNAILFTGAGFSTKSINIENNNPPESSDLAKKISQIISTESANYMKEAGYDEEKIKKIKEIDNLMIASDFFIRNIPRKERLLSILKNTFTIKNVTDNQVSICALDWRRIYTTNYDNTIEMSTIKAGKTISSLDLKDIPKNYKGQKDICLHINGKIDKATPNDLDEKIKLSTSSYLSADQFLESTWYSQFKTDIDNCSAIVFIGYSMYDMDIQKILFKNDEIKRKTFFITKENSDDIDNYTQSIFGNLLNIGVSGFAEIARKSLSMPNKEKTIELIKSMDLYQLHNEEYDIRDSEIYSFMLFGNVSDEYIDQAVKKNTSAIKIIERKEIDQIVNNIKSGNNIIITGDIGNGKTVLIKSLMSLLTRDGYECYIRSNNDFDFKKEIEILSENKKRNIIFIDDYSNKIEDVRFAIERGYNNIQLVISTRHYGYEATKEKLISMDTSTFKSYNIDYLNEYEIDNFIELVNILGAWGEKAGLSKREKLKDLDDEAKTQLSLLLLSILNSEGIKNKIKEITDHIINSNSIMNTTFVILLMDLIGIDADRAMISKVSGNNDIYSQDFTKNYGIANIFRIERGIIKTKSSTLSRFIINNAYSHKYIPVKLLEIVKTINESEEIKYEEKYSTLIKSLLRFSIIEKLLPQKRVEINFYYEKLKEMLPRLINDPHYWVQYAMSAIQFKEYKIAKDYLETAYSHARNKNSHHEYHTRNIDTQRARLHFLVSTTLTGKEAFDEFHEGDKLMTSIPNDIYKYRQVLRYKDIYNKVYKTFSTKNRVYFEHAIKRIIDESNRKDILDDGLFYTNSSLIRNARDELQKIVTLIEGDRK